MQISVKWERNFARVAVADDNFTARIADKLVYWKRKQNVTESIIRSSHVNVMNSIGFAAMLSLVLDQHGMCEIFITPTESG